MGVIVTAAVLAWSYAAFARADHDRARTLRQAGAIVPLEQILEAARARYPGRLLEAELEEEDDRYVYEIEWVGNDGTVRTLRFDAQTGSLLASDPEE